MLIGSKIKELRLKRGLTQTELAKLLNTTKQNISKYEKSVVVNIPLPKVEELAEALGCTPSYLMGWTEEKHRQDMGSKTVLQIIEDAVGSMFDNYCKYPEQYEKKYKDEDEASEKLCDERCVKSPMNKLT